PGICFRPFVKVSSYRWKADDAACSPSLLSSQDPGTTSSKYLHDRPYLSAGLRTNHENAELNNQSQ
ncbi:MAG: hypothetical protein ACOC03_05090, partial [Desulfosalsimonas sp.]